MLSLPLKISALRSRDRHDSNASERGSGIDSPSDFHKHSSQSYMLSFTSILNRDVIISMVTQSFLTRARVSFFS